MSRLLLLLLLIPANAMAAGPESDPPAEPRERLFEASWRRPPGCEPLPAPLTRGPDGARVLRAAAEAEFCRRAEPVEIPPVWVEVGASGCRRR